MSEQDLPVPPVPEHTPPLKEDAISPAPGKYFSHTWTRWFISLREKINVINDIVINISNLLGSGGVVSVDPNGQATTVGLTDIVAGTNISFSGSGTNRILDDGSGPITINAPGTGGLVLVASQTVTGSATTFIEFTGLDLDTHGSYLIQFSFLNSAGSQPVRYNLFYNGDSTVGNYITQVSFFGGNLHSSQRYSGGYIADCVEISGNVTGFIDVIKAQNGRPMAACRNGRGPFATVSHLFFTHFWNSSANVTVMRFETPTANGFGIGSFIRIYRF